MDMKLVFSNGGLYYENMQFLIFPSNSFLTILHHLNKNYPRERVVKMIRGASKIDSKIYYDKIKDKKIPINLKISKYLEFINSLGIGETKIFRFTPDKIYFNVQNLVMTQTYNYTFEEKPEVFPEEIIVGFIKHFLENLLERKIDAEIESVKNSNLILKFNLRGRKKHLANKHAYPEEKYSTEINQISKKILSNKHLKLRCGVLQLWGIYATILPYFFLIELTKNFKEEDIEFFKTLGRMQGKAAVGIQQDSFGIEKEFLFKQILQQFDFIGMGTVRLLQIEPKVEFILKNNFSTHYKKYYSNEEYFFLENYFVNDVRGIYESIYGITVEIIKKIDRLNKYYKLVKIMDFRELSLYEREIDSFVNAKILINKKKN